MAPDARPVFFFDIDNCLYPRKTRILNHMSELIDAYFRTHLSLSAEESAALHQKYYKEYGLAIEGLVRHHKVDPLEFNAKVDDAVPLDDILKPDEHLKTFLDDFDRGKVRLWLLTNAYVNHGRRVVRLLDVEDFFEGLTYCDYAAKEGIVAKPSEKMYRKAMREAGVEDVKDCYFVDDSYVNIEGADKLGWTAVHLVESTETVPEIPAKRMVRGLEELRTMFPQFFKSSSSS